MSAHEEGNLLLQIRGHKRKAEDLRLASVVPATSGDQGSTPQSTCD